MRKGKEIRERLDTARKMLEDATMSLSRGGLDTLDLTGVASAVGMIHTLEWVLGERDDLTIQVSPVHRPLDDI